MYRIHRDVLHAVFYICVQIQEAKHTECWPCPPFDILLNKYFPAGQPGGRQETPVDCWCILAGNVLHHIYPLEYQVFYSQPRQKSCWASSACIQPLGRRSKKLYTLAGKPPSEFVHPVVGEGLCTSTGLERIVVGDSGFEGNPLRKQLMFIFYFPESPLISSKLSSM